MRSKRYLLIDAYNVIHAVKSWYRTLEKDGLECARYQLAERAVAIHDAEDVHTILILDSRNESLEFDHPFGKKTFEYVYAPARLSADVVIEQIVTRIARTAHVTVASDDAMVRESARVNGAIAIGSKDLFDWICACERQLIQDAARRRKTNEKQWRNSLEFDF